MRLIVSPEAENDIATGYEWYEEQRPGLGVEFLDKISTAIASVQSAPLRFPIVMRDLRRALVQRFPYGIFFVAQPEVISVVAAMHLAREPQRLHDRIK